MPHIYLKAGSALLVRPYSLFLCISFYCNELTYGLFYGYDISDSFFFYVLIRISSKLDLPGSPFLPRSYFLSLMTQVKRRSYLGQPYQCKDIFLMGKLGRLALNQRT